MNTKLSFTVNAQPRTVITDPLRPLLEALREDLQATGTKYGCGESQCGACTVLLDGRSVRSCVTPVAAAPCPFASPPSETFHTMHISRIPTCSELRVRP